MSLPRLSSPIGVMWLVAAALFLTAAGCEEPAASTPEETFRRLQEYRRARTYAAMRPYLHASGREGAIDLLVAVDELLLANAAVQAVVRQASPTAAVPYDFAAIEDRLEILSREVNLIGVRETGNRAVVTFQIARRLPVVSTQFVRTDGMWQYVPAPDQAGVVKAIRQLTRALSHIELSLTGRPVTLEQVQEEYRLRVNPRLRVFERLQEHSTIPELTSLQPT